MVMSQEKNLLCANSKKRHLDREFEEWKKDVGTLVGSKPSNDTEDVDTE